MPLAAGEKLGPYEIQSALGAGGMGEVYRARDTRLDRTVAIKILASHLSSSPELKQRFEREARAISSLNHTHICQLYDVGSQNGTDFLVMEFLEGETLAERLRKGALALNEILKIGSEVAEALETAHKSGIIHRDLKPGNIMLTKSGAKLMDFGLAKPAAMGASASGSAPLLSAVKTASGPSPLSPLTTSGSIVGTIQYMSPEQIEGKEADARSDIFALGAVLYEMATGKRAFEGKSQISVASAILEKDPEPISAAKPLTPAAFERVVNTCLAKEPERRFMCAHDLGVQLKWLAESPEPVATPKAARGWRGWQVIAGILGLLLLVSWAAWWWRPPDKTISMQAYLLPPDKTNFTLPNDDFSGPVVLSPDGKRVAFVAEQDQGHNQIFVRALDDPEAKSVPGTERATYPFWSPDGNSLGFFSGGAMHTVPVGGGPVLDICPVQRARGGSWGAHGILFAPDVTDVIYIVAPNPGAHPRPLTKMAEDHTTNRWPMFMPDGKHFIYLASNHSNPAASGSNGIYFASLDGKDNHFVAAAESNAIYSDRRLLWVQDSSLLAQTFDPSTGKVSGETQALATNIGYNGSTWRAAFDAKDNGVLVYQPGTGANDQKIFVYSRDGNSTALPDSSSFMDLRISPDGRRAAALTRTGHSIWILDLAQGTRVRFSFEANSDGFAWSSDSKDLVYTSLGKPSRIYRKAVDGVGKETVLYESPDPLHVCDVSPDGKSILFEQRNDKLPMTTWLLTLAPGEKPRPLIQEPIATYYARFSADGKWISYGTTETGDWELYATSMAQGGKLQLTSNGGMFSRWAQDGKTIYYSNLGGSVYALPTTIRGDSIELGKTQLLFKTSTETPASFFSSSWDATPDGKRFLLGISGERQDQSRAVVVTNWQEKLKE